MSSGGWLSDPPRSDRKGAGLFVKAAVVLLALPAALLLFLLGQSKRVEAQAWPVIRQVAQRLRTDAEAGQLYRANPALARTHATEEAFLERVRAHREPFAALPDLPPGRDRYECFAGPNGFLASVQGSDGSWVRIEVRKNVLFETVPGEGLLRVEFSPAKAPNDRERSALRRARAEADWRRYRELCAQLASPDGTRTLWQRESGLHRSFPREADLQVFAAGVRPHLRPVPEPSRLARLRLHRQVQGPQGETVRLDGAFPGGTLTAVWTRDQLTGLEFVPR